MTCSIYVMLFVCIFFSVDCLAWEKWNSKFQMMIRISYKGNIRDKISMREVQDFWMILNGGSGFIYNIFISF